MDYHTIFATISYYIVIQKTYQYENLSLNKTVTVSQRYNNKDFDPSLAVDGDHSTDLLTCSLTASGQKEAWLTVDLGEEKTIASISFIHGGLGSNAKPIPSATSGIYRIQSSRTVQTSTSGRRFLCYDHFTTNNVKVVCLIWGLLPDNGEEFSSKRSPSNSLLDHNLNCMGNEAVIHDCPTNDDSCSSYQDFAAVTELRCKVGDTLSGFSVYVSDTPDWRSGTLCYQHDIEQPLNNSVSIDCFTSGRYVTIYNSRLQTNVSSISEFAYINICEINVTGCDIGFYGENCTKCPDNCLYDVCHFQIGHCFDCKDDFKGEMCEECPNGRHGKTCSFLCGNCLNELSCNYIDGVCQDGCSSGWTGDKCDEKCSTSQFGPNCNTSCSEYCLDRKCNQSTGHCLSCIDAHSGLFCENINSPDSQGMECPFTVYGPNCNTSCSEHCQHRLCNHTTGHCLACAENRFGNLCENELPAKAAFDIVSVLAATTTISLVVIVVLISYILRKKYLYSRQTPTRNHDVPEVIAIGSKYETLQRKKPSDEFKNNSATEYMEIASISPEYTNLSRQ